MLKVDLHIHSINSGHAYGSFYDIVNEARKKGLRLIGISDHGPSMNGVNGYIHFVMRKRLPKYDDLRILWGCEANILDAEGNIDLDESIIKKLDFVSVSLHNNCTYIDLGKEKNTLALLKSLTLPYVKILTHPESQQFPVVDFEKIFQTAIDNNVLLELNIAYLKKSWDKKKDLFKQLVEVVKRNNAKLIVGSDAHFIHEIGDDSFLREIWDELDLTDELIMNNYPDELLNFLEIN